MLGPEQHSGMDRGTGIARSYAARVFVTHGAPSTRGTRRFAREGAMMQPVWRVVGAVVVGLMVAACGGGSKPPMVPDAPDPSLGVDAGPDVPSRGKK